MMKMLKPHAGRTSARIAPVLALSCLLVAFALPARAATSDHQILIDADFNPATGCTVTTADGPFTGVEQILTTSVETDVMTAEVTGVERQVCDPGTNTFGPPVLVSNGGWPVGVGIGVDGSDVVETFLPLAALDDTPSGDTLRLAVTSDDGTDEDAMLAALPGSGSPILLDLTAVTDIPTLSEWALILFTLLLVAFALSRLRRQQATVAFALLVVLFTGLAWAAVEDGMIDDWAGEAPIGQDPEGDAPVGVDLRALFGMVDGGEICFRIDVFLEFEPPNEAPDAMNDGYAVAEDSGTTSLPVLANDTDPDGDPLTITGVSTPDQGGTAVINGSNIDYTPADDFNGVETFTYDISDGNGGTDTATVMVTVTPVNDPPVAVPDMYATQEDTPLSVPAPGVLANDTDIEGDMLTAVLDMDVSNGTLTLNADGSFTYTPDMDFNGTDTFTYHANDGTADSNTVTVTITVGPVNDGPNAIDDMYMTDEDTVLNVPAPGVLLNDFDTEGDPISVTDSDMMSTLGATVMVNPDGSFTYDPTGSATLQALADGATTDDTFTYTIDDGSMNPDTATVTVTVTGVDDPPTAVDDSATVNEDAPATTIDVLANDDNADGGPLSITSVTQPANGMVVITNMGADLTYEPDLNYCNDGMPTDDFTYTLNGGSTATVRVTVTCVNDDPMADDETLAAACNVETVVETDPGQSAAASGQVALTVNDNVLVGDSDPVEGDAISIVSASGATSDGDGMFPLTFTGTQGGAVTLHADGSFTFTPEGGDRSVADTFTYTIQDAEGGTDTGTVTVNVGSTCVWFVDNSNNGGTDDTGSGTSSDPFTSMVDEAGPDDALADDAEDASLAGDVVYVFVGNSEADAYQGGYDAQMNERILGEGVDLVVDLGSGPQTLFDSDETNEPEVANPIGDIFTVTDVTGVEIAGFELNSASDSALQVTSTGANDVGVDFHDNVITGAGAEGISVEHASTGDAVVSLSDNDISATGDGIDLESTAGGDLFVTDLCGLVIDGATLGDGINVTGATFDADPADADFDEVTCSAGVAVGEAADPVGGTAMSLDTVEGDLAFGDLDLFTDGLGETGLEATGTGLLDMAATSGFELTSTSGTISSTNGPAVVIDPTAIGLTLDAVSSANSPTVGVLLEDVGGFFTATAGSITGSVGNAFDITSTLAANLDVSYGGTITNASGAMVNVDGHPGGTVLFNGANLTATGGTGLQFSDADGTYMFPNQVTLNGGDAGVDIVSGSSGAFTFTNTDITSPTGIGINVDASGPSSVSFGVNSQLTYATAAQAAVSISDRTAGTFVYTGQINATNGNGLQFDNDDGTTAAFNNTVTLNGGDAAVDIVNGSTSGYTFSNMTITNPSGTAFNYANSGGALTWSLGSMTKNSAGRLLVVDGMTSGIHNYNAGPFTQDVATGTGVLIQNKTGGVLNFNDDIDLGANNRLTSDAVTLANNTAGSTTFSDLDARTSNARAFVKTGSGVVTVTTGTVDATGAFAGEGLDVSGGTSNLTFTDVNVTNNGAGGGVSLTNTAGTKTLSSVNVTTTTSGTGFDANNGGTVNVTGAGNTVSATGAVGVSLVSTTVGGSDVTFQSVSASGAANGIVLNSTGTTGDFAVTGDGGSTVNGSGGLLTNITTDAIRLTDAEDVSLDQLNMSNVADNGINGVRVNGLVVANATYTNMGNADGEDVFSFDRDTSGDNGLIGTALFQNLTITNFAERAIDLVNEGAGTLDLDILNVSADNNNDTFGEDAIRVQNEGSVNADVLVSGGTFNNLELDVLAYFAQGTGTNTVEMTGVTSTNGGGPDNNPNGGGVAVIGSAGSTTNFDINANNMTGVQGSVVQIIGLPGSGQTVTLNGTIGGLTPADGNTLSTDLADGIDLDFDGDGAAGSAITGSIVVRNNTINFDDDGIGVDHRDAGGTMNVTIRDNTLNTIIGDDAVLDADDGIFIFIDDDVGSNVNALNLEIIDNTVNGLTAGKHVIVVEDVQDGNDVCLGATGNSNGGGNGDIELDTDAAADLVVDATSAANLSALNNGLAVNEVVVPTYNSAVDCIP